MESWLPTLITETPEAGYELALDLRQWLVCVSECSIVRFSFVPEGFKRFNDGVELVGHDSSQALERCGSFLELGGGEHDLILPVRTL
jgi:hypothetical protein